MNDNIKSITGPLSAVLKENIERVNKAANYLNDNAPLPPGIIEVSFEGLSASIVMCHALARHSGWWNKPDGSSIDPNDPNVFGTKIALIHSEVSEALEGGRKNKADDHLPNRKSVEVELADAAIRIFDTAGAMGLDLAGAIVEKLAYNQQRADHKMENRAQPGGKAF